MKTTVSALILLFFFSVSFGKTYYVSATGTDGNSGTSSSSPFKSFSKVLSVIGSGDTILLKRGDVFRDSAVLASFSNLVIKSYGSASSARPVVSGADVISGWTLWKDQIYVATASKPVRDLFVDNVRMTCARFPNSGWIRIASGTKTSSSTNIISSDLAKNPRDNNNYWVGTRCHWHRWSWWDEVRDVLQYTKGGTLVLKGTTNTTNYPMQGWGFYMDNKLTELDSAYEWFQDKTTLQVYLRTPKSDNPSLHLVEGTVRNAGLSIFKSKIEDVAIKHQYINGVIIDDSCTVNNCLFENIFYRAIHASDNAYACLITNNEFYDNNNICINWYAKNKGNNVVIEHNIMKRTAIVTANQNRLYGFSSGSVNNMDSWWPYNAHSSAIVLWYGTGALVRYNRIDSTGYIPISLHGNYASVEYNYIKDAVLNLNDGSCIYVDCDHTKIRYNIVLNAVGCIKAAGSAFTGVLAHGIWPEYIFDFRYNVMEYNTAANCSNSGIFLTSEFYDTVRNNVLYNNKKYQIEMTGDVAKGTNMGHVIENNILFAVGLPQKSMTYKTGFDYGSFKNNFLGNPFTSNEINPNYTPEQFDLIAPWSKGGNVTDSIKVPEYRSFQKGTEMMLNNGFTQAPSEWETDAKSIAASVTQAGDQPLMNGTCMKVAFNAGKVILNYAPSLPSEQGSFYELKFNYTFQKLDVIASSASSSMFSVQVQDSLTRTMHTFASFPASKLMKTAWMIIPCKTTGNLEVQISHSSTVANTIWIDNISLKKVRAQVRTASDESKLIFNDSLKSRSIPVGPGKWHDIYGKPVSGSVTLAPFRSIILVRSEEDSIGWVAETFVPLSDPVTHVYGNIIAYPNPVVSQVCITGITEGSILHIYDLNGILVYSKLCGSETEYADLESQQPGIYLIVVTDKKGSISTGKIMKQ